MVDESFCLFFQFGGQLAYVLENFARGFVSADCYHCPSVVPYRNVPPNCKRADRYVADRHRTQGKHAEADCADCENARAYRAYAEQSRGKNAHRKKQPERQSAAGKYAERQHSYREHARGAYADGDYSARFYPYRYNAFGVFGDVPQREPPKRAFAFTFADGGNADFERIGLLGLFAVLRLRFLKRYAVLIV